MPGRPEVVRSELLQTSALAGACGAS